MHEGHWQHLATTVIVCVLHCYKTSLWLVRVVSGPEVSVEGGDVKCAIVQVWHLTRVYATKLQGKRMKFIIVRILNIVKIIYAQLHTNMVSLLTLLQYSVHVPDAAWN